MSAFWGDKSRSTRYRQTGGYKRVFRQQHEEDLVPTTPAPPFGKVIEKLQKMDLDQGSKEFANVAKIKDVKAVSSYTWLDDGGRSSSILIPGKPPRWTPHSTPPFLREDDGKYFRDKNAARYPKHPMEPSVLACLETDPSIPSKTDIVTCGSTLGNLLRFVRGQDKTFRMLVEKVENTVFFIRRENSPRELIPNVRGYGHTFPQAYTTWDADVPGSVSHQRIVSYNFAGLDIVARFEADGYLPSKSTSPIAPPKSKSDKETSIDGLANLLLAAQVGGRKLPPPTSTSTSTLQIKQGTSSVDQTAIFDLKTRSIRSKLTKDHLDQELPRLWVSRIPNFILAFHTRGEFKNEDIQIKDVRADVARWETDHATDLAHLAALIHRILDVVSQHPNGKIEVSHQEIGTLHIHEQLPGAGDVLSAGVRARWESLSMSRDETTAVGMDEKVNGENMNGSEPSTASDNEDDYDTDGGGGGGIEWDEKPDQDDFTACTEKCGYCGKCSY